MKIAHHAVLSALFLAQWLPNLVMAQNWCCKGDIQCDSNWNRGDCWTSATRCWSECNSAGRGECKDLSYTWLCSFGCQTQDQCFNIATCIKGPAQQSWQYNCAAEKEKAQSSCPGKIVVDYTPVSYPPAEKEQCKQTAEALNSGGCTPPKLNITSAPTLIRTKKDKENTSGPNADPCPGDQDGSLHACYKNCTQVQADGADQFCQPPAGSTSVRDCHPCHLLWDENSCGQICGCSVKPPPPGSCPKTSDEHWGYCGDPKYGGSENCVWCQSKHSCVTFTKENCPDHCPDGYVTSCGKPESQLMSSTGSTHAVATLPTLAQMSHLCSFACDDGTSLFRCLSDGCPDAYQDCKRADSYKVSSDSCDNVKQFFRQNGGQKVEDRTSGHVSVAGKAMYHVALNILKQRELMLANGGPQLGDITADEIASGVKDLENKGLEAAEGSLCEWTTGAGITFCSFVVKFPTVQWVNQQLLNAPVVEQVTHQIATLAEGAVKTVEDTVKDAVSSVAHAVSTGAKDVINTVKNAASGIVHSVLNFFSWAERSVFAAVTRQRGRVALPASEVSKIHSGDDFNCWVCPCGGMGCGGTCTSYPARGVTSCQPGEFIDQEDCDRYCSSGLADEHAPITKPPDQRPSLGLKELIV